MAEYETIITETEEGIGRITINRPNVRNALNTQVLGDFRQALVEFRHDREVGVVVFTGAGEKSFAAGADIGELRERTALDALSSTMQSVYDEIEAYEKPTIAAVNGYALGGGCELALACDFRIVSEKAKLGQPEILLGIIPGGGGTQRLARLVGPARAKDLIFSGRQVRADEALAIGLVDEVVPAEEVLDRALDRASALAAGATVAQGLAKRAIDRGLDITLNGGLDLEQQLFADVFTTDDARIGVQSFLERGPGHATFTGR